jgi:integrase
VFAFGKPWPQDPTRPVVTLKAAWGNVKRKANVQGRWHDNRHTFITDLAESGEAGDGTIRDMAGHVSPKMLKHYSHIGMDAKRRAVESLVSRKEATVATTVPRIRHEADMPQIPGSSAKDSTKVEPIH